jgi:hypothetical protein
MDQRPACAATGIVMAELRFENMTTSCCAPQEGCVYCKTSRRIRETWFDNVAGERKHRFVHLRKNPERGFVDCAIQTDGQPYDHRNKGATRG